MATQAEIDWAKRVQNTFHQWESGLDVMDHPSSDRFGNWYDDISDGFRRSEDDGIAAADACLNEVLAYLHFSDHDEWLELQRSRPGREGAT
jgi:hypothetical protein